MLSKFAKWQDRITAVCMYPQARRYMRTDICQVCAKWPRKYVFIEIRWNSTGTLTANQKRRSDHGSKAQTFDRLAFAQDLLEIPLLPDREKNDRDPQDICTNIMGVYKEFPKKEGRVNPSQKLPGTPYQNSNSKCLTNIVKTIIIYTRKGTRQLHLNDCT